MGVIGFLISSFVLTPVYEASATMIVNTRQDQSSNVTNDQLLSAKNLVDTTPLSFRATGCCNRLFKNLI